MSLFFILGFVFDFFVLSLTRQPLPDRFSILDNTVSETSAEQKTEPVAPDKEEFSFFETLSRKNTAKPEPDMHREEALRMHRPMMPLVPPDLPNDDRLEDQSVYSLQLGSFKGFSAARTFRDNYIAKGYRAYIVSGAVPGSGTLYRVRIGRFKNREEAQAFSEKFEKKEQVSAFITSK